MISQLVRHTEKLHYFYEVANEGSYHAAARKLSVSAPTISYSIKQLEDVMDTMLFLRGPKGVTLTDSGQTLFGFCRKYYRDMAEMMLQIRSASDVEIQRIKVATFQSIAIYFWPMLVESLGDHPELSLSISTGRSQKVLEMLVKKEVDIAITVEDFHHSGLIKHELYDDHYAFYCSSKLKKRRLDESDVIKSPLLYIPDAIDENRRALRQHVYAMGLVFQDEFEMDSFEVIGEFVKRGYGVGILPTRAASQFGKSIQKVKVGESPIKFGRHRFFLSYRDDLDISQHLMDLLLSAAMKAVRAMEKKVV